MQMSGKTTVDMNETMRTPFINFQSKDPLLEVDFSFFKNAAFQQIILIYS